MDQDGDLKKAFWRTHLFLFKSCLGAKLLEVCDSVRAFRDLVSLFDVFCDVETVSEDGSSFHEFS